MLGGTCWNTRFNEKEEAQEERGSTDLPQLFRQHLSGALVGRHAPLPEVVYLRLARLDHTGVAPVLHRARARQRHARRRCGVQNGRRTAVNLSPCSRDNSTVIPLGAGWLQSYLCPSSSKRHDPVADTRYGETSSWRQKKCAAQTGVASWPKCKTKESGSKGA